MPLEGLVAATYTPFLPDRSIHLDLIKPMTDYMIDQGVAGFYVCGSTGEGESLTTDERKLVATETVQATQSRVPVVIQVGHNSLETSCDLARHAADQGADAISSVPPTYFKPANVNLLVDSIASIASAAPDLPYYYYHIPRLSGVTVDPVNLLEQITNRVPNFAGIKFSDFFLADFMACQEFDKGRYDILFGSDEMLLGALATGARGAVGSCYGFAAPLWLEILRAFDSGDMENARAWMSHAARLVRGVAQLGPFQACVKQVLWPRIGFETGPLRLPQPSLTANAITEAERWLDESGFGEQLSTGTFVLP